ncbi:SPASM domain-containing protein [Neobacillus niacini]|nr:SPASM domain-containing protein [Neobacillus niacini]
MDEKYKLGNIRHDSLESILYHERMEQFLSKKPSLPEQCQSCELLHLCHGGCPRNRIGENNHTGVEFFCESYKQVYRYAHGRMLKLAAAIKRSRINKAKSAGAPLPGRNELCLCGSRKKFKKCCETLLISKIK